MAFKFVAFLASLALANAGYILQSPQQYLHSDEYQQTAPSYSSPAASAVSHEYNTYSAPMASKEVYSAPSNYQYEQEHNDYASYPSEDQNNMYSNSNNDNAPHYTQQSFRAPATKTVSTYSNNLPANNHYNSYQSPTHSVPSYRTQYVAPEATKTVSYAPAQVSYETPTYSHSNENAYETNEGSVSNYANVLETPTSNVHKYNTQITNQPKYNYQSVPATQYTSGQSVYSHNSHPAQMVVNGKSQQYAAANTVSYASFEGHGTSYKW